MRVYRDKGAGQFIRYQSSPQLFNEFQGEKDQI